MGRKNELFFNKEITFNAIKSALFGVLFYLSFPYVIPLEFNNFASK